jgi:hypothetical protein
MSIAPAPITPRLCVALWQNVQRPAAGELDAGQFQWNALSLAVTAVDLALATDSNSFSARRSKHFMVAEPTLAEHLAVDYFARFDSNSNQTRIRLVPE